jgi:hypothetical protein
MAVVFDKINFSDLEPSKKGPAKQKLSKWVVGAALDQRYQEGVHNKQATDAKDIAKWIQAEDADYEPAWLREVKIPSLTLVTPNGAVGKMLRCLINREILNDPLTKSLVNIGIADTQLHHIFPTKFAPKMNGWEVEKGDKTNLLLNTMQLAAETNVSFLNDDPKLQIANTINSNGDKYVKDVYKKQGITEQSFQILAKDNKIRDDYRNFLKLRETYFENILSELDFGSGPDREIIDDSEDA